MLIAKVTFTDVDGRSIQKHYTGTDVEEVINRVGYNITIIHIQNVLNFRG